MISRRRWLGVLGTGLVNTLLPRASATTSSPSTQPGSKPKPGLTTIAYNVFKCTGWPAKLAAARLGDVEREVPERLAQELMRCRPDIVNFSEAPPEPVVRRIADRMGMKYAFFPSGQDWPGAILSRLDIAEARNCPLVEGRRPRQLFSRHWGRALVWSEFGELAVHSVHLHASHPGLRKLEALEVIKAATLDIEEGRSVIVQGDLNHSPRWPTYRSWVKAGLVDTQAAVGNGDVPTINARKPRIRIDYVLAAGPIADHIKDVRVLFEGAFRTNPDDTGSFALSDHLPVLARFEL